MLAASKQDLLSSAAQFSFCCSVFESVRDICLPGSVMAIWQLSDLVTENSHIFSFTSHCLHLTKPAIMTDGKITELLFYPFIHNLGFCFSPLIFLVSLPSVASFFLYHFSILINKSSAVGLYSSRIGCVAQLLYF